MSNTSSWDVPVACKGGNCFENWEIPESECPTLKRADDAAHWGLRLSDREGQFCVAVGLDLFFAEEL